MDHTTTRHSSPAASLAAGIAASGGLLASRVSLAAAGPASSASCSCCCAARSMAWPRCRRSAIRTTRDCGVNSICLPLRRCPGSTGRLRCIPRCSSSPSSGSRSSWPWCTRWPRLPRAFALRCAGCARERLSRGRMPRVGLAQPRAGRHAGAEAHARRNAGVALGANIPLVMRGPPRWPPGRPDGMPDPRGRHAAAHRRSVRRDPLLSRRLADALAADAIAGCRGGRWAQTSGNDGAPLRATRARR